MYSKFLISIMAIFFIYHLFFQKNNEDIVYGGTDSTIDDIDGEIETANKFTKDNVEDKEILASYNKAILLISDIHPKLKRFNPFFESNAIVNKISNDFLTTKCIKPYLKDTSYENTSKILNKLFLSMNY
jgi:hypothetical protein